ncbi:MAG: hypothetical protein ACOC8I_04420 [Desulfosalsimonas sp.]
MSNHAVANDKPPGFTRGFQSTEKSRSPEASAGGFPYLKGLANLIGIFCVVWFLWYIFMNPDAVMKLYTPMYGFALVASFLCGIILLTNVFNIPAVYDEKLSHSSVVKGIVLTIAAVVLMYVGHYLIFWGIIGKFAVAYFSPASIVASGGIGAEPWAARENASIAIVYFCAAFLWLALFWNLGFNQWPWQKTSRSTRTGSKFIAILFFTTIIYIFLFHPHVCHLFYPTQDKAGVAPWWEGFAGTGSAFFGLALVLSSLVWIVFSDLFWEGYPWKKLEKNGQATFAKGIVTFIGTLILGIVLLYILLQIFTVFWDEAFMGGQYTDGPDWRLSHAAEVAGFFILAAFILKNYFNNFPNFPNLWARAAARSVIAVVGGMLIYWFYFSPLAVFFLARVEGFAQPDDKPLVWVLLFLGIILVHNEFFDRWPLKQMEKESS